MSSEGPPGPENGPSSLPGAPSAAIGCCCSTWLLNAAPPSAPSAPTPSAPSALPLTPPPAPSAPPPPAPSAPPLTPPPSAAATSSAPFRLRAARLRRRRSVRALPPTTDCGEAATSPPSATACPQSSSATAGTDCGGAASPIARQCTPSEASPFARAVQRGPAGPPRAPPAAFGVCAATDCGEAAASPRQVSCNTRTEVPGYRFRRPMY